MELMQGRFSKTARPRGSHPLPILAHERDWSRFSQIMQLRTNFSHSMKIDARSSEDPRKQPEVTAF